MNRAELARVAVAAEALAKECRAALGADAAAEWEEQATAPTWRMPGLTVSCAVTHPSVHVVDEAKFLDYVKARHPHQIETVVRVYPSWQKLFLDELAGRGEPLVDDEGTVIPGLSYHPGGAFSSLSIRPSAQLRYELSRVARDMVSGAIPLALPAVSDE